MNMRKLGRSGLQVSPLAFGGNVFGWTADEQTSFQLLDRFVAEGFNFIDTADVYGGGKIAADADEAGQLMNGLLGDMNAVTARVQAAIDTLKAQPQTDTSRMGAMGYCLGGALSLHAARLGLDLRGVVSFHGSLGKTHEAKAGDIKAKVLVCHGADDKFISDEELAGFKQEMADLNVDMTFESYPGALHGFTNPEADEKGKKYGLALAYDAAVDKQSWEAMRSHWAHVFA